MIVAKAGQDTGSCIPPTLEMPFHKLESSLFLHNFTVIKVEKVCVTGWTFLHLVKFYSSHLKITM